MEFRFYCRFPHCGCLNSNRFAIYPAPQGVGRRKRSGSDPGGSGDRLEVQYTHSMFGVPQIETFSIGPNRLFHLEKVSFGSQAAALYYDPNPAQRLTFQDNLWVSAGNGKNYPVLRYRVSPGTGHVFMVKDRRVDLSGQAAAPGMPVEVKVEERSRILGAFAALWKN